MPSSPWRRIPFASIAAGLMAHAIRLDRIRHRQLDISHGCQDHTVLPYATAPTSCAPCPLTDNRPANIFTRLTLPRPPPPTRAPPPPAPPPPPPASGTIATRPS